MLFQDVTVYQPTIFTDFRGDLLTIWDSSEFEPKLNFNHDKISSSSKNVLRGLHGDKKSWKLTSCLAGELYFVVVDARPNSINYLKWDSIILNDKTRKQVLTPPGFAIGFLVLSNQALLHYKWSYPGTYPDVDDQFTIKWNDPMIDIYWPTNSPILSKRDTITKII